MIRTFAPALALLLLAGVAPACSRGGDAGVPVAAPTVTLSKTAAAIGSPMEMTYRFAVAPEAPVLTEDYWVFVHFVDRDGELMWTDDHEPATPTRQWKAGSTIEYTRPMFVPKFPYVGQTTVEIGLFSPTTGERLPLAGPTGGQRAYRVAAFEMRLDSDALVVVFNDGWYDTEVSAEGAGHEWQWSKKEATLSFRNPKRAVRFYLQADQPAAAFAEPQQVEVRLGAAVVDRFALAPGPPALRQVRIAADQLGPADTVAVTISVDKTFVPASLPALKSTDPRELGVRVFRAFVEPN
ncbi:MAG: hypothetical protein HY824_04910 [Acidobacteria bacterium]|nr:hypothetical protein [Acidobacteriota bacterium]